MEKVVDSYLVNLCSVGKNFNWMRDISSCHDFALISGRILASLRPELSRALSPYLALKFYDHPSLSLLLLSPLQLENL